MRRVKEYMGLGILMIVTASFSQCSSAKDFQEKPPVELGETYYQRWIGGIEGGGAGLNIFVTAKDDAVVLDSVYFRGKAAKLETKEQAPLLYIGRFISDINQKKNMVINAEPTSDEKPIKEEKIPFELKDNECIISYRDNGVSKYFKISKLVEKEMIAYPSAPPHKQ